jgi:hypothetical protein
MLASSLVKTEIPTVVDLLARKQFDEAKKKLDSLAPNVRTERERGAVMAANGILLGFTKRKEGAPPLIELDKLGRAAKALANSSMLDEFDRGFSETLLAYAKVPVAVRG